ncbi:MAG: zinc-ribbon domain-containing protein [Denitromonas halophila]|nr:MAG: zinc-ribbon domain-containing protein [Denitromonas halophila]
MICHHCGAKNEPNARFCRQCGSDFQQPRSANEVPPLRFCAKCGAALKEGMAFCGKCGAALDHQCGADIPPAVDAIDGRTAKPPSSAAEHPSQGRKSADLSATSSPAAEIPSHAPEAQRVAPGSAEQTTSERVFTKTPDGFHAAKGFALYGGVAAAVLVVLLGFYAFQSGDAGAPVNHASQNPKPRVSVAVPEPPAAAPSDPVIDAQNKEAAAAQTTSSIDVGSMTTPVKNEESADAVRQPSMPEALQTGVAKPAAKRQPPVTRSAIEPKKQASEQPKPSVPNPQPSNWRDALARQIQDCGTRSFFERVACIERAKWKYCNPGHWGKVPECPGAATN